MNQNSQAVLPSPGEALEALGAIMRMAEESGDDNRRINHRVPVSVGCEVQPLREDFSHIGEPISAICRNVSVSGVGFVANQPITADLVRIEFPSTASLAPLFLNVRHQTNVGPFYVCGGEVAVDWEFE